MTAKINLLKLFPVIAILAMIFSNVQPQRVEAQSGDGLKRQVNAESGRVSFITPANGKSLSAARALGESIRPQDPAMALAVRYAPEFGLQNAGRSLTAMDSNRSDDGRLTVRYQQNYESIPVMGGELIVNTNDQGDLYSISGEVSPDLSISTKPVISSEDARQTALGTMAKWYGRTSDDFTATEPELWIYDESLLQPSTRPVELSWRMEVTPKDDGIPVRELVLVNAQRGSISLHFNQVDTTWTGSSKREAPSIAKAIWYQEGTGATWYVATSGNNSNDCATAVTPCATINAALSKAAAGDTIKVAAGTYKDRIIVSGSDMVVFIDKSITISGGWDPGFATQYGESIIDGEGSRSVIKILGSAYTPIVNLERLTIQNGYGYLTSGGGIENYGTLTINQSNILRNRVGHPCCTGGSGGGGIANYGSLLLKNSSVSYNSILGGFLGSAINNDGTITINNTTISYNSGGTAISGSGAIYNDPRGLVVINNSTISYNQRGIENYQTVTMSNTIVARNETDCYGPITSLGYNLVGIGVGCTIAPVAGDLVGTDVSIDPHLNPLQNNGGFTLTQALAVGSPAVDAGNPATCLPEDQRGFGRPVGVSCDIGAYEGTQPGMTAYLVETYSSGNTSSLRKYFLCDQNDPNCMRGDQDAKAAHNYAIGTFELFKNRFSRNSIDNQGMIITSNVHYCAYDPYNGRDICPYDNASWNGEQMVFGDAHGYALADDIVAHELTHGVTQYESNLFYYYQSGAINESFSDLWGEYYDQTNYQGNDASSVKWIIGEDVAGYPVPAGFNVPAMRSMSNPPALGDPDMMTSSKYYKGENDNGGVHHNSGINNKAVYLMVNGGTFNTKTVSPLDWDKVGAIYYEVNTNLLTSGADYSDLYYALQLACANLIGKNGIVAANCVEVKDAIDAVQMYAQPVTNFNPDATLCSSNKPVIAFADDLENGPGKWTFENIGAAYGWQLDSPYGPYAQSGQHFLYADDYPQGHTNAWAKLASFVVPNNAYLWFAQAYDFETGYKYNDPTLYNFDGGVLEYSLDGGMNWVDAGSLIEQNGYKGKISGSYSNWLYGRSGFVGSSHGYISTRLNLATLAGKTVHFRWWMGLDNSGSAWGWWVDNVKVYTCGGTLTFADVPASHPYYNDIEILFANGLTGGCSTSPLKFCPDQGMNRAQAAVFMLRGNFGSSYVPPVPTHIFKDDWSKGTWAEGWAEAMRNKGLSAGCSTNPLKYCPWDQIPREQAVIFALRMKYGTSYTPPPATGTVFADMTSKSYYATSWAEQAYKDGIIPNCGMTGGKPKICPKTLVSRGLAAYMIVKAKNLTMP